jgi:hypothetical protein
MHDAITAAKRTLERTTVRHPVTPADTVDAASTNT